MVQVLLFYSAIAVDIIIYRFKISFSDQTEQELERKVTNSWNRYWSLKDVFKNKP